MVSSWKYGIVDARLWHLDINIVPFWGAVCKYKGVVLAGVEMQYMRG